MGKSERRAKQGSPIILSKSAAAVRVGISGVIYEFKKLPPSQNVYIALSFFLWIVISSSRI